MTLRSQLRREDFQSTVDGKPVDLYYLTNKNGVELSVTNFGARIVEWWAPDRDGNFADIVLGHDTLDKYVNYTGERFLGATIGRYGNRIARGRFSLDGVEYRLPLNNGPNSLHGGDKGFDMVVWDARQTSPSRIDFSYISADGEQGYPGRLTVSMSYELDDENAFHITHTARTDKRTVVNLTHHSFFNLHGAGLGTINDYLLTINADSFTPVDETLIPTGKIVPVEGTPMDFRQAHKIGERVDSDYEQLKFGGGYDHNWVLNKAASGKAELAATLYEPVSGRILEVFTTEPGIQFYGGNFFDGTEKGKGEKPYNRRATIALETQHFPDSPNQPHFPSTELSPGEEYKHVCVYRTSVK